MIGHRLLQIACLFVAAIVALQLLIFAWPSVYRLLAGKYGAVKLGPAPVAQNPTVVDGAEPLALP